MLRLIDLALDWKYTPLVWMAVTGSLIVLATLTIGAVSGLWLLALLFAAIEIAILVGALAWGWWYVQSW